MRELIQWADQFPTVTVFLSKTATVDPEKWIMVVPFDGLTFDHRPENDAKVGFVLDVSFGMEPSKVQVRKLANTALPAFTDFDSRGNPLPYISLEVEILEAIDAFTDIPLVIVCAPTSTDIVDDFVPPALPAGDTSTIDVVDIQGGVVDAEFWQLV